MGFGFFIDEIGKFVTSDNDYFSKPAAGMIYIVFLVLYFAFRELSSRGLTPQECLANAMQILSGAASRPLREHEDELARDLLARSDPNDPLVEPAWTLLERAERAPDSLPRSTGAGGANSAQLVLPRG